MSCIRFKFKSSLDYDQVTFTGLQLTVAELREKIMDSKKLGLSDAFTLEIMDAQTKKVYKDDNEMVPRNSSVIIMRVPKQVQQRLPKTKQKDPSLSQEDVLVSSTVPIDRLKRTGDLAGANATEEEKVMAMMSQAGEDYNPANYAKFRKAPMAPGLAKPPPPNYVCHRCNQKGHWIKFCPTNGDPAYDKLKKPSGIPSSHVVAATANTPGVMRDRYGNLVVRAVDVGADIKNKGASEMVIDMKIPDELTCKICKELVRDAVIIPCCSESFCDECIREYLLENGFVCFACKETDVSPDNLVSNKSLRITAKNFQSQLAERKGFAVARGLSAMPIQQNSVEMPIITETTATTTSSISLPPDPPSESPPVTVTSSSPPPISTAPTITKPIDSKSADEVPMVPISVSPSISKTRKSPSPQLETTTNNDRATVPDSDNTTTTTSALSNTAVSTVVPSSSILPQFPLPLPLPTNPLTFPSSIRPVTATVTLPVYPQPLMSVLPNPAMVLPTVPTISVPPNPFGIAGTVPTQPTDSVARLTAELLAATQPTNESENSAPLSLEEFYKQQKLLRRFAGSRSRSPSVSSRSSFSSRSYYSSRSPSPYWSSRSRSVSPKGKSHKPHVSRHKQKRMLSPTSHSEKRLKHKKRERDIDEDYKDMAKKQKRLSKQSKKSKKHKDSKKVKKHKSGGKLEVEEPRLEVAETNGEIRDERHHKHKHHQHRHRHHKKKRRHSHSSGHKGEPKPQREDESMELQQDKPGNGMDKEGLSNNTKMTA